MMFRPMTPSVRSRFRPAPARRGHRSHRPILERVEERVLLSGQVFEVDNTNDSGLGSFRQAILDSNANAGFTNTIVFNIGSGGTVITPLKPLPTITTPVVIDGTSQPGFGSTPIVELVGSSQVTTGLTIAAGNSTVQGLVIEKFAVGISVTTLGNDVIQGNDIGTNATGTVASGNTTGIWITTPNNTVGGTATGARNVISANQTGVSISGAAATGNVIQGNYVGTDRTGAAKLGNSSYGIAISSNANTIGGIAAGNLISGNSTGLYITSNVNVIQGNLVGTDATGKVGLGNSGDGIYLFNGAQGNTVGGIAAGTGNILSANGSAGLELNRYETYGPAVSGTVVQGNAIGTGITGTEKLGNAWGIVLTASSTTQIGGSPAGAGNLIANNTKDGILGSNNSSYSYSTGDTIAGNTVTNNSGIGIHFVNSMGTTVGGTSASAGNSISGNAAGVNFERSGSNLLAFNSITGNLAQGVIVTNADEDTISSNGISGNIGQGIYLDTSTGTTPANQQQAAPYLLSVSPVSGDSTKKTVSGIIFGNPSTSNYTVELFSNVSYNANGSAQGAHLIGTAKVSTDASGKAPFSITYTVNANEPALSATVTDPLGNTSPFSGLNPAPTNRAPTSVTTDQNAPFVFSSSPSANRVSVTYLSSSINPVIQVTIQATSGTVQLSGESGLNVTGEGSSKLVAVGALNDVNAALNGLTFTPARDFSGDASMQITTSNLAGIELGGEETAVSLTGITVVPLATSPTVTSATTTANTQTTSGLVITPGNGTPGVDEFLITNIVDGNLFLNDGVTPVPSGSFISKDAGGKGLIFTPGTNFIGQATFSVQGAISTDADVLRGTAATGTITVNKLASRTTVGSSTSSPTYGQPLTFTATVSPSGATGSITFYDGATQIGSGMLSGGTAIATTSTLSVGTHSITAQYAGDAITLGTTSAATSVTTGPATTSTTLGVSSTSIDVGDEITLTATVSPEAASGTVTFYSGATSLGSRPLSGGTATLTTKALPVGSDSITAKYSGDTNDATSTSAAQMIAVNLLKTTTTMAVGSPSITAGQSLTLTATVSPATATGMVTFFDGTTSIGTATLSNGTATTSSSSLAVGNHSITAKYGGDASDGISTSTPSSVTVNPPGVAATTTTLSTSSGAITIGQSVTFTAIVSSSAGTPTGTVAFLDGSTTLGTAALVGNSATFTAPALSVGSHSIVAQYQGTSAYGSSSSTSQAVQVSNLPTSTSLSASTNSTTAGQSITFTATVAPAAATGTVTFYDGTTAIGTGTLSGGTATLSTSSLAIGTHAITAEYVGDASDAASTSAAQAIAINNPPPAATTTTLRASAASARLGDALTFTATVSPATATGTLIFLAGGSTLGTAALSGGTAILTSTALPVGSDTVVAQYQGDASDQASTSAPLTIVVGQASTPPSQVATVVTLQLGPNPGFFGQPMSLTATVQAPGSGIVDGGQVRFVDGTLQIGVAPVSNGAAVLAVGALAIGTHDIRAYFDGDASFASSVSTVATAAIQPAPSVVSLATSTAGASARTVVLSAHVASWLPSASAPPTGIVQFFQGEQLLGDAPIGDGGVAVLTVAPSASLVPSVHASYMGDAHYLPAASAAINAAPVATTTAPTVTVSPTTIEVGAETSRTTATTTLVDVAIAAIRRTGRRRVHIVAHVENTYGQPVDGGEVVFLLPHRRLPVATLHDGTAAVDLRLRKRMRSSVVALFSGTGALLPSTSPMVAFSGRLPGAASLKRSLPASATRAHHHG